MSFKGRCCVVGVFGNNVEAGESSIGMFVAIEIIDRVLRGLCHLGMEVV